jgi:hypothetical protein
MPDRAASRISIHGLKELDRALGRSDKTLRTDLRQRLKRVAEIVAQEARGIARPHSRSGDLIAGIKPVSIAGGAAVRSSAIHQGYSYPTRLEYEGRKGRAFGPLASINPAIERRMDDITRETEKVLDELGTEFDK